MADGQRHPVFGFSTSFWKSRSLIRLGRPHPEGIWIMKLASAWHLLALAKSGRSDACDFDLSPGREVPKNFPWAMTGFVLSRLIVQRVSIRWLNLHPLRKFEMMNPILAGKPRHWYQGTSPPQVVWDYLNYPVAEAWKDGCKMMFLKTSAAEACEAVNLF